MKADAMFDQQVIAFPDIFIMWDVFRIESGRIDWVGVHIGILKLYCL